MSEQVGVRPGDLEKQAAAVTAVGARVSRAAGAGRVVRPGVEAYGKMCLIVPQVLGALQDTLVDGIDAAAESLHDTAARLETTAQAYADTDEQRAAEFDRLRRRR
ncbi:ESX-1 secretion-associated protein [Actinoplanes bogorensis]|uniref:ESX-1 secretion-associated protein n=1 Tax=Paractinoplanes bogorensis TaxID=1610840 RepID=A0ABS5Z491_9ACTN|nr:type VII secretion target [Actinoplanes bogorensis]MBU2670511.1 ESX-1 secretion-associated protein [Actinoplanes bogorensis]